MADILSQDEIAALTKANAEAEADGGAAGDDIPPQIIHNYDFKHPPRVNKDQLRTTIFSFIDTADNIFGSSNSYRTF